MKQAIPTRCGRGLGTHGLWEHHRGMPSLGRSVVVSVVTLKEEWTLPRQTRKRVKQAPW